VAVVRRLWPPRDRGETMRRRTVAVDPRQMLGVVAGTITTALVFAPWVLGFSASHAAVAGHIAFAMGVAPIALLITSLAAAAVTTTVAGAWLAASPWILDYAGYGIAAWTVDMGAGLALIVLSAVALRPLAAAVASDARSGHS
jgi:hypothetical protein